MIFSHRLWYNISLLAFELIPTTTTTTNSCFDTEAVPQVSCPSLHPLVRIRHCQYSVGLSPHALRCQQGRLMHETLTAYDSNGSTVNPSCSHPETLAYFHPCSWHFSVHRLLSTHLPFHLTLFEPEVTIYMTHLSIKTARKIVGHWQRLSTSASRNEAELMFQNWLRCQRCAFPSISVLWCALTCTGVECRRAQFMTTDRTSACGIYLHSRLSRVMLAFSASLRLNKHIQGCAFTV
ncbi:hypothetical protein EDD15DRAFT_436032 [Pisolithus albus]|nr:hypothetical protein EDD15DRAFT_436032 [Pisolithus albus]